MKKVKLNKKQQQAVDLILSGVNVFLTGDAGTGKTTVVQQSVKALEKDEKNVLIAATTGVAAEAFKANEDMDKNGDGICQYMVLEGEAGQQDSIVRTEYSVNTLIDNGVELEKLGYAIANWNRAKAKTKTAALLTQYAGRIELIIANNDDMALGAIDALRDSKIPKEDWPGVVGIDGTDVGLAAVKRGEMIGTVYNDKEGQAQEMLNLAFAIATGGSKKDIPFIDGKYVRTPYHKVTLDNVDDY